MKKIILMIGVMSAGLCWAGDFVPANQNFVPRQQIVLIALAGHAALGNRPILAKPEKTYINSRKQKIVQQKNSNYSKKQKNIRINQPRKGY